MVRNYQLRREVNDEPASWDDAIAAAEDEVERLLLSADHMRLAIRMFKHLRDAGVAWSQPARRRRQEAS